MIIQTTLSFPKILVKMLLLYSCWLASCGSGVKTPWSYILYFSYQHKCELTKWIEYFTKLYNMLSATYNSWLCTIENVVETTMTNNQWYLIHDANDELTTKVKFFPWNAFFIFLQKVLHTRSVVYYNYYNSYFISYFILTFKMTDVQQGQSPKET